MEIALARTRFDAFAAFVLVVYAAVFTGLVAVAHLFLEDLLGDTGMFLVYLGLVLLWLFWSGLYVFTWTRMRRVGSPLALEASGVCARSQFGELTAPWEAVASAAIERAWNGKRLRIRLVPATDARFEEIGHASLNQRMFEVVQREGLRYSLRVLDIDLTRLREAFVVQSGGRVQVG